MGKKTFLKLIRDMATNKINMVLAVIMISISIIMMLGSIAMLILSSQTDLVPHTDGFRDWNRVMMILSIPIGYIGDYFYSLTTTGHKGLDNDKIGYSLLFMIGASFIWARRIHHFTTPIVAVLALTGALMLVALFLTNKKLRNAKAAQKEHQHEENQAQKHLIIKK